MNRPAAATAGFTLVEVMVVVVLTAIVAAIAWPSYADLVRRGALQDGSTVLAAYAQRMDAAYDSSGNYSDGSTACAVANPASTTRWSFACTLSGAGQGFTATATGIGVASGYAYTITNTGERGTTRWAGSTVTKGCWLVKGTEC
jgi:type IV pilus assembly protein PilE